MVKNLLVLKSLLLNLALLIALVTASSSLLAQNTRTITHHQIGWYNYFGNFKLNSKWGIHSEYQWRRVDWVNNWQQSLLRVGVHYQAKPGVLFRAGYAWIETFAYGDIPLNSLGRDFTEHRIFEMVQLSHKESRLEFSHRFMLEQRFVGRYTSREVSKENEFPFLNRMRYMFRVQAPIGKTEITDKTFYAAIYNEVFIGFGKNVGANIFDQNRLGGLIGYRFSKNLRAEAGYLSQILQYARNIEGKDVYQINNGIIINVYFTIEKK